MSNGPFRDREHMMNCLLDEILKTRRPGETAGQFAARLSPPDLQTLYWQRKIREYAEANGYDPDADEFVPRNCVCATVGADKREHVEDLCLPRYITGG